MYISIRSLSLDWNWIGKSEAQEVTDYKLELKITECILVNIEILIFNWNFEFRLWISNFGFKFRMQILKFKIV